ncbi:hypothetical protein HDU76_012729 [Blyttiomyces sp. JEL0837]|nr:hypothetical protein HDU76_012729 [Blyttiomyces sp. JEL0837]
MSDGLCQMLNCKDGNKCGGKDFYGTHYAVYLIDHPNPNAPNVPLSSGVQAILASQFQVSSSSSSSSTSGQTQQQVQVQVQQPQQNQQIVVSQQQTSQSQPQAQVVVVQAAPVPQPQPEVVVVSNPVTVPVIDQQQIGSSVQQQVDQALSSVSASVNSVLESATQVVESSTSTMAFTVSTTMMRPNAGVSMTAEQNQQPTTTSQSNNFVSTTIGVSSNSHGNGGDNNNNNHNDNGTSHMLSNSTTTIVVSIGAVAGAVILAVAGLVYYRNTKSQNSHKDKNIWPSNSKTSLSSSNRNSFSSSNSGYSSLKSKLTPLALSGLKPSPNTPITSSPSSSNSLPRSASASATPYMNTPTSSIDTPTSTTAFIKPLSIHFENTTLGWASGRVANDRFMSWGSSSSMSSSTTVTNGTVVPERKSSAARGVSGNGLSLDLKGGYSRNGGSGGMLPSSLPSALPSALITPPLDAVTVDRERKGSSVSSVPSILKDMVEWHPNV